MGSDLYRVRATDKTERSVMLEVKVMHPDANHLPEDPSGALMLLLDDAPGTSVLAQEVSVDDAMDDVWLQKYVRGFVSSVQVTIESGTAGYGDDESPPDDETEAEEEARLERRRASWLKGRYAISVTDPAWVEHLAVGKEWDSRAFAAGYDYDDCAPIRPGRVERDAASPEGFLWIPRELWADMNPPAGTPRLVPIPALVAPEAPAELVDASETSREESLHLVLGARDEPPGRAHAEHLEGGEVNVQAWARDRQRRLDLEEVLRVEQAANLPPRAGASPEEPDRAAPIAMEREPVASLSRERGPRRRTESNVARPEASCGLVHVELSPRPQVLFARGIPHHPVGRGLVLQQQEAAPCPDDPPTQRAPRDRHRGPRPARPEITSFGCARRTRRCACRP
jgi:hypothetical protein